MRPTRMLTQALISCGGVTDSALQTAFGVTWLMLVTPIRPMALWFFQSSPDLVAGRYLRRSQGRLPLHRFNPRPTW